MKRAAVLSFVLLILSCKKQATQGPDNSNDIQSTVLSLISSQSLDAFSMEQRKALIDYLDIAPDAGRRQIDDKLRSLSAAKDMAPSYDSEKIKTTAGANDPVNPELFDVGETPDDYIPGDNWTENVSGAPGAPWITFNYNWTVAKQVTNIYSVVSKEQVQVVDQGSWRDPSSRYPIQTLSHMSSYIPGLAPGISWTENNHQEVFNLGGYNVALMTGGVLSAIGFNREMSATQYANMSMAYATGGANVLE